MRAPGRRTAANLLRALGPLADGHPTTRDLYGITCANAVTCYAVGDGGTIVARQ